MHRIAHGDVSICTSCCWDHCSCPGGKVRLGMERGQAGGCRGASCWFLSLTSPCSKNLTWRDMQHLVVQTSKPAHLNANDWVTNGVGRKGTGGQGLGAHHSPAVQEASGCSTDLLSPQSATPTATACWTPGPW